MTPLNERHCSGCVTTFPLTDEFFYKKPWKDPTALSSFSSQCRPCIKKYKQQFYVRHKERLAIEHRQNYRRDRDKINAAHSKRRLLFAKNPQKIIARRAVKYLTGLDAYLHKRMRGWRASAKGRSLEFSLTREDIVSLYHRQNGKCFYTGIEVQLGPNSQETLSLDRLDSKGGYTLQNAVICTRIANMIKWTLTLPDLYKFCELVLANRRSV